MSLTEFRNTHTWIFDLDHTLYPPSVNLFAQIEEKMRLFVSDFLGVSLTEADHLRAKYWASHGTTLAGMMACHNMPPEQFLIDVHDIDFSVLPRADGLARLIRCLPGRKIVYTNGTKPYAQQVLAARGLDQEFESVFGIEHANYHPKPEAAAFAKIFELADINPIGSAFFEDDPRNLIVPFGLGLKTVHIDPNPSTENHITAGAPDLEEFLQQLVAALFSAPRSDLNRPHE